MAGKGDVLTIEVLKMVIGEMTIIEIGIRSGVMMIGTADLLERGRILPLGTARSREGKMKPEIHGIIEGRTEVGEEEVEPLIIDITKMIEGEGQVDRIDKIFVIEAPKNMRATTPQMQAPLHEHPDVAEISSLSVMTPIAGKLIETPEIGAILHVISIAITLRENIEIQGKRKS